MGEPSSPDQTCVRMCLPRHPVCTVPWPEVALCAPLNPKAEPRSSSPAASFLSSIPSAPRSGCGWAFCQGLRIWRVQGVKVAMRQAAASSPTLASLPPPHKSASSSIRCPRLWLWGAGAWQPSGECPRRAPKPAPPLRQDSLPLLLWRGEGWSTGSLQWEAAREPGGGQADSHALFGAVALGAALYCRWGPRERRAGDGRASAAASSPPRPVPQDCSWH